MLINPTLDKLQALRLSGMTKAYREQLETSQIEDLTFDERLALLVEREVSERDNRRLAIRLKKAKFKEDASMVDVDYHHPRGLKQFQFQQLAGDAWLKAHQNLLIVGPTGTGKTYLACAVAHNACLQGYSAHYVKFSRILQDLVIAKGDGRYNKKMDELCKYNILILDDWGMTTMTAEYRRDLLEILDERHNRNSTIVTSQYPVSLWHEKINDNTMADAILDRLIHNADRIALCGESIRKTKGKLTSATDSGITESVVV